MEKIKRFFGNVVDYIFRAFELLDRVPGAKSWLTSKTLWVNTFALIAHFVLNRWGIAIPPEWELYFLIAVNYLLRILTKEEIVWDVRKHGRYPEFRAGDQVINPGSYPGEAGFESRSRNQTTSDDARGASRKGGPL